MQHDFPWLRVIGAVAKLTAVASLFAYLLHLAGLRLAAIITITLAHVMALFCVFPAPGELVFATTLVIGTCTYAILAVDRPWLQVGVVSACLIGFGLLLAQESRATLLVSIIPMALWIGLMVVIRDWARTQPKEAS